MKMNGGVTRELSSERLRLREARRPDSGATHVPGRATVRRPAVPRGAAGRRRTRAGRMMAGMAAGIVLIGCTAMPGTSWQVEPAFRIVDGGPSAVPGYLALARKHEAEGRATQALAAYRKAADAAPQDADLHNTLGLALARHGQFASAVVALRRAVALAPERAQLLNNLGYALMLAARPDEARRMLSLALAVDPAHEQARWNLGHVDQAAPAVAGRPAITESTRVEAMEPAARRAGTDADSRPAVAEARPPAMASAAAVPSVERDAARVADVSPATTVAVATATNPATTPATSTATTTATSGKAVAATGQHQDWRGVSIEIINGNGVSGAAHRMRELLRGVGLPVGRLANRVPYDSPQTTLLYRKEKAELARAMAVRLPVSVHIVPAPASVMRADLSLLLGRDLRLGAGCGDRAGCATSRPAGHAWGRDVEAAQSSHAQSE